MDQLNKFKNYLLQGKIKHSKITVKNYLADVRKFIFWYESSFNREFSAWLVTPEIVNQYKTSLTTSNQQSTISSARSLKRYFSSLKKFYAFLLEQKVVQRNPFDLLPQNAPHLTDKWHIKEFENFLILSSASKPTIKNYLVDVKQFRDWVEKITVAQEGTQSATTVLEKVDSALVDEYKNRLLYDAQLSAVSINRKLSSLRKYFSWAISKGFIKQAPAFGQMREATGTAMGNQPSKQTLTDLAKLTMLSTQPKTDTPFGYSSFPPFRLIQKLGRGSNYIFDLLILLPVVKILVAIRYNYWKMRGRKVFVPAEQILNQANSPQASSRVRLITTNLDDFVTSRNNTKLKNISNFPKALYAPLQLSTRDLSLSKRLIFHLRYTRPKWYKRYHSYAVVHYLHFAIFVIYAAVVSLTVYQAWVESPHFHTPVLAALPGSPPRMLAFKGTLTDVTSSPITAEQTLRFSLYNSSTSSGSALLWEETQEIKPDSQGNFSTLLGKNQPIYQSLLNDNPNLFIGIAIGRQPELSPRQQIATTAYSKDAERLQGLLPVTDPNAGTRNIILALNSSGNLTIGGSASPKFEATGGEFTISGQTLTLTTLDGSNTNIQLKPNGTGIVDIQKPIQNTSNYGMIPDLVGAVQFADSVGIMANSSSQSALLINQNSTGDIISASGSGTAKFTVNYMGAGTFADDLAVNGNNLTTDSTTFNLLNQNVFTLNIGNQATEVTIASASGRTTINSVLDVQGLITAKHGLSIPENQKITFSGLTPGGVAFLDNNKQFSQDQALFWDQTGKRLGLGSNAPLYRLDVRDDQATNAVAQIYNTSTGSDADGLIIKLGNITPTQSNNFISFVNGNGTTLGKITGNNPTNNNIVYNTSGADYAEYFKKADIFEVFEPGDVVCLASGGVTKCQNNSNLLGVVSGTAGFVGAGNHDNDPTYILVGLVGQLPVKIQAGSDIKSGDPLTLSNGSVIKATDPGIILGHALEDPSSKLLPVALNITWYNTNATLSSAGNLSTWEASQPKINQNDPLKDYIVSIVNEVLNSALPNPKVISPLAEVDHLKTNLISPLSSEDQIALKFENDKLSILNSQFSTSSAVATIDNQGNASFSGTLRAKKIIADEIEGLKTNTATVAANYITNITNVYNNIATPSANPAASSSAGSTLIADSNIGGSLNTNFAKFDQGFISLGASSLTDVAITGKLRLGDNLVLSDNSINTIGTDLSLQPLRQGNLSLMGDLVKIDTEGNLNVGGNAIFAKDVTIKGILAANIIAPVPDQDLLIRLPTGSQGKESKVEIQTASGSGVLSINQLGNLISSGSANFVDITAKAFTVIRGVQADTSFTRTVTDASAGSAVITAYETERTIVSPFMKKDSLIYITATSDTQGITPYIARQTQDSFTIQIPHSVKHDIKINWWIVN